MVLEATGLPMGKAGSAIPEATGLPIGKAGSAIGRIFLPDAPLPHPWLRRDFCTTGDAGAKLPVAGAMERRGSGSTGGDAGAKLPVAGALGRVDIGEQGRGKV